MDKDILDRVKNTRTVLRTQIIETILDDFDKESMKLDKEKRMKKYRKMMESPFRFFRGSNYLFYYDMIKIPFSFHTPEHKPTWIQGDLHMDNFGAFQNEAGEIVYDVNDFDEGYVGSYLYDVLRMSVSIALYCEEQSMSEMEQEQGIRRYLKSYYKQLKKFKKGKDDPFTLIFTEKNTKGPVKKVVKKLLERQRDHLLKDITHIDEDGKRVFALSDEIKAVTKTQWKKIEAMMDNYHESLDKNNKEAVSYYAIKDISVKHGSGTASIGLDRFYILIEGGKEANGIDDLVLEMKEVRTPIPAYFLPYREKFWECFEHQGKRVVATQEAMHHLKDPHLGYVTMDGRHFYVRERSPYKKKVKSKHIKTNKDMDNTLKTMGKATAKIHARADADFLEELFDYQSEEEILKAIGDEFDQFSEQIIFTAMAYKEQVNRDYDLFCAWVEKEMIETKLQ